MPEWSEDFTENLVDEGVSASTDTPASLLVNQIRNFKKSGIGETQYFHSLPERPKLRSVQEEPRLRALFEGRALVMQYLEQKKNIGDLKTADHKVLNEGCESRSNHR